MDNVRWQVTDPLGNELRLGEENFQYHIIGRHDEKDAETRQKLEEHVKYFLQAPRFIIKDKNNPTRKVYLDLVDVSNADSISVRSLCIVVENNMDVVTWFVARAISIKVQEKEGIVYDRRVFDLQVR